jgi:hypothetical protein
MSGQLCGPGRAHLSGTAARSAEQVQGSLVWTNEGHDFPNAVFEVLHQGKEEALSTRGIGVAVNDVFRR